MSSRVIVLTCGGPHETRGRPHQMRRARPVRGAAARADPPRRLGLPDRRSGRDTRSPRTVGTASSLRMSGARSGIAATRRMSATVFGIADDHALGGSLRLVVTNPNHLRAAKSAVDQVVGAIDHAASRFREDSELSRLNASPEQDIKVSPLLAQAIAAALRGAELTAGAVDPTIGSAIRLAGYDADFAQVPADGAEIRLIAHRIPGWRAIQFAPMSRMVRLPRGVEIDLGATAKALASDLAAAAASKAAGGAGVLMSLGGDIACARSEEHTSELQSHLNLVCRLLLEKKKKINFLLFLFKTKTILLHNELL